MKIFRRLRTNRLAFYGAITILALISIAIFAPLIAPQDPNQTNAGDQFAPPFIKPYLLGADELGRDVLSRIIVGSRVSLMVAALAVGIATLFGATSGIVAGYFGGRVDGFLMRINDVLFSIPALMLALSVVGLFGRSVSAVIFALGVAYTPIFARVCYSGVVSARAKMGV